jgi:hypothetical protein
MDFGGRIEGSYASLIHLFHDKSDTVDMAVRAPETFRVRGSS